MRRKEKTSWLDGDMVWEMICDVSELDRWHYCYDGRTKKVYIEDAWHGRRYPGVSMDVEN